MAIALTLHIHSPILNPLSEKKDLYPKATSTTLLTLPPHRVARALSRSRQTCGFASATAMSSEDRGAKPVLLSPRPAPRQADAVVVMAPEALATAALSWQGRAEVLMETNARLKKRLVEVEEAHRKSLTVVKNVPALPNNHVFTKNLVEENHALRKQTQALQRRLMQFEGPGAKQYRKTKSKVLHPTERKSVREAKKQSSPVSTKSVQLTKATADNQGQTEFQPESLKLAELAHHPLVQELKSHLGDLEVNLNRLKQENELLRTELDQYQNTKKPAKTAQVAQEDDINAKFDEDNQEQLRAGVDGLLQQVKMLEIRYQHLEEKARVKAELLKESTFRIEELTTQLFEAQEQLGVQAEKLQAYSDETARMRDLQQDLHLVRSENVKLNEVIAALSSRPFDMQSRDLQVNNLLIAQLEEEKHVLEEDCARIQAECIATKRTNKQLFHRVETMTAEVNDLANKLNRCEIECEQRAMENDVAQLQLRFYTAPGDYNLMSTIGKAIKDAMKQQQQTKCGSDTQATIKNNQ